MEKVDLEAQEANSVIVTNPEEDTSFKVFEMDKEGNVVLWNPEGFVQLCEQSEDPALKAMLAIYNLGIIEGCRAE